MLIGLIPVFNEEKNIISVLNRLKSQTDYIVIVNDGSRDRTGNFISEWIKDKNNVFYISYERNKGMAYALKRGFYFIVDRCKEGVFSFRDSVVTIDADGQHDPEDIGGICRYFNKHHLDVLITKRNFLKYPRYRIVGNKFMSGLASCLGGYRFDDVECGLKILKVAFIQDLLKYYSGFRYSCSGEIGIISKRLGYSVDNKYPIQVAYYRNRGPNFMDLFINIFFLFLAFLKVKRKLRKISIICISR